MGGCKPDEICTHVGTHTGDQDDGASTDWDHVTRCLAGSEECTVNVDVIQPLYPVEGVVERGVVLHDT